MRPVADRRAIARGWTCSAVPLCSARGGAPAIVQARRAAVNRTTVLPRSTALHEPTDAGEGFLEPLIGRRVAGAHVLGARWTEGTTGHDGDVLLLEQAPREGL